MFAIFPLFLAIGCQENQSNENNLPPPGDYLFIKGPIKASDLSDSEKQILFQAFCRLKIEKRANGLYQFVYKSAKEANMNEELYNYFEKILNYSNKKIMDARFLKTRSDIILDDTLGTESGDNFVNADCVIWTIVALLNDLGVYDYSYGDVESTLSKKGYYIQGSGVSNSNIEAALGCFVNYKPVDKKDLRYSFYESDRHYMVVGRTKNSTNGYDYHCATVMFAHSGYVSFRNDQNPTADSINTYYDEDDVVKIYEITKK